MPSARDPNRGRSAPPTAPHEPSGVAYETVEVVAIAQRFREFAEQAARRLPLYRRLCEGVAGDLGVASQLLLAAPDQREPNLLLAAVHDLLLSGEADVLADWYQSIPGRNPSVDARSRAVGTGDDDPWPHFRRLALEHPGVAERLRTRSTQTNEVGRSAALFPALFNAASRAASAPPGGMRPLGIVEIGSSAGLNLHPNAYGYRYRLPRRGPQAEQVFTSVGPGSKLMLDCELRGERVPPLPDGGLPIDLAVGIDRHPLDLTSASDARWLVACQWPEQPTRMSRLAAAIVLSHDDPPVVDEGDAVDDLRSHLVEVPAHALPVVVSSWVLAYLPVARQRAFIDVLDEVGDERDLALVFSEQPERVPGIPVPPRPDGEPAGRATALVRIEWHAGERTEFRLADQHPHGTWLEWLSP